MAHDLRPEVTERPMTRRERREARARATQSATGTAPMIDGASQAAVEHAVAKDAAPSAPESAESAPESAKLLTRRAIREAREAARAARQAETQSAMVASDQVRELPTPSATPVPEAPTAATADLTQGEDDVEADQPVDLAQFTEREDRVDTAVLPVPRSIVEKEDDAAAGTVVVPATFASRTARRREIERARRKVRARNSVAGVAAAAVVAVGAGAWHMTNQAPAAQAAPSAATATSVVNGNPAAVTHGMSGLHGAEAPSAGTQVEAQADTNGAVTEAFVVEEAQGSEEVQDNAPLVEVERAEAAARDTERTEAAPADQGAAAAEAAPAEATQCAPTNQVIHPMPEGSYRNTSGFGYRVHPIFGTTSMHAGTDYAAPFGTNIHAIADGTVIHAGPGIEGRSGTLVIIQHEINGQLVESWYTHMSPNNVFVAAGQHIEAGDILGLVGSWGNSTGPHLHFELHVGGTPVEPISWLANNGAVGPSQAVRC